MQSPAAGNPDPYPSIVSGFGYSPLTPALWRVDSRTALQMRDLSLAQASNDVLSARHLRTAGVPASTDQLADPLSPFAFVFVLAGRVTLTEPGREPVDLRALDSACRYGSGTTVKWELSHDAEIIEIAADRKGRAVLGFDTVKAGKWLVSHDEENSYLQGDGPRAFFRYRDLQVAEATGRRIHIHVVRATKLMDGGTGWHSHSMGQIFYVLRGWADLCVDRQPFVRMSAGDAMCVHPRLRHNVPAFSADYLVLELCAPADYDTADAAPP
jgi:mannose-6-phosphate isomerase-like protein (cupin superfamily)